MGSFNIPKTPPKNSHAFRKLIAGIVNEKEEEAFKAKAVQLHLQGYWTQWCDFVRNDLSWRSLLAMPPQLVSFCLGATFNTLPCPSNLKRWRLCADPSCLLCGKSICTSAHILGACKVALEQGRFTYRHDCVLRIFVNSIREFLTSYSPSVGKVIDIQFVKAVSYTHLTLPTTSRV